MDEGTGWGGRMRGRGHVIGPHTPAECDREGLRRACGRAINPKQGPWLQFAGRLTSRGKGA